MMTQELRVTYLDDELWLLPQPKGSLEDVLNGSEAGARVAGAATAVVAAVGCDDCRISGGGRSPPVLIVFGALGSAPSAFFVFCTT